MIFKETEKAFMSDAVSEIIQSFGDTMTIRRSAAAQVNSFSGAKTLPAILVGVFAVEIKTLSPQSLTELGADLVIQCAGDVDIREGDLAQIDNRHFIVSHIDPQKLIGVVTHVEVNLEKDVMYGS